MAAASCWRMCTCGSSRARSSPCSVPPGRASRHCCARSAACCRPSRAGSCSAESGWMAGPPSAVASASCSSGPSCCRTSTWDATSCSPLSPCCRSRSAQHAVRPWPRPSPTSISPASNAAGWRRCRAARPSVCVWLGSCWRGRAPSCSTSRSRPSTPRCAADSPLTCAASSSSAVSQPSSSRMTRRRRHASPTGSSSS